MNLKRWLFFIFALLTTACGGGAGLSPTASSGTPSTPSTEQPVGVLVGAGDIGWPRSPGTRMTGQMLDGIPGTVFAAGDIAYFDGKLEEFLSNFDPFWGRHKSRMRPAPGNHEYNTGARGYFTYFGPLAGEDTLGYYDFTIGSWYGLSLNSNVRGGLMEAQLGWLRSKLAANPARCTVAIWHHPLFSLSKNGDNPHMKPVWQALDAAGADVIIAAHDHLYGRQRPQTASGAFEPDRGIRQFTVGTGGAELYACVTDKPTQEKPNVEKCGSEWGLLKLTLYQSRFEWSFVSTTGATLDSGQGQCH